MVKNLRNALHPLDGRIYKLIDIPEDTSRCWIWLGFKQGGYGRITNMKVKQDYGTVLAHRVVYMCFMGPIPDGMGLDHGCNNPACVNPQHLTPMSNSKNSRLAAVRRRITMNVPPRES